MAGGSKHKQKPERFDAIVSSQRPLFAASRRPSKAHPAICCQPMQAMKANSFYVKGHESHEGYEYYRRLLTAMIETCSQVR